MASGTGLAAAFAVAVLLSVLPAARAAFAALSQSSGWALVVLGVAQDGGLPHLGCRQRICVDPGIGFGKTVDHNLEILNRLDIYRGLGLPVLLGVSRKSFIAKLSRGEAPKDRVPGSLAAVLAAWAQGVWMFRVHDVAETRQALAVAQAIGEA